VLHRDAHLVALDKPAGYSLLADRSGAPCLWDTLPTVVDGKPYLAHRLDKGTSGVLLVARDQRTQSALTRAFGRREVRKFYVAWVTGDLKCTGTGTIDLPLRPGRKSRYRVAGPREAIDRNGDCWTLTRRDPGGVEASTRLRVLARAHARTLLLLAPRTGRTHQLRVHLAWIGHPIAGDSLYGRPDTIEQAAARLMLHCHRLVVPGWGTYRAPLPADFA
jgi:tRNA pseudouridine32 synthase/23S rRNA pseudouridine746 synthase/23S rRNA pseudouridine1911/1915/1917 synthase